MPEDMEASSERIQPADPAVTLVLLDRVRRGDGDAVNGLL